MTDWVKREQRILKTPVWRKAVLISLAVVALALPAYKFTPELVKKRSIIELTSEKKIINSEEGLRSFLLSCLADLNLDTACLEKQPLSFDNRQTDYPDFKMAWPEALPLVWLVSQVNTRKLEYDDLTYEALELANNQGLLIWFLASSVDDTLGELYLETDSNALPLRSSIAFLFDNFADFKRDEALKLAEINIPFGFILKPDQVPDKKLSKTLKTSQGQCLLQIPADRQSWDVILNGHRLAKHIPSSALNSNNIRMVLEQFPALEGFYFVNIQDLDQELVRIIIDQSNILNLTYVYRNTMPSFADSLAYLKGLKLIRMANLKELTRLSDKELQDTLLNDTKILAGRDKSIFNIAGNPGNIDVIKALLPLYAKLNIILAAPLHLATPIDSL